MKSPRILMALALVAGVAVVAAVVPRVDAQGQTIKIGILFDHTGPVLGRRLAQLLARRQDDDRLHQREGRRARQVQDRPGRTATASPRPTSPSTRPSGS